MIEIVKKFDQGDDQALMDELERHFKLPGAAQSVFEEIKRAEAMQKGKIPMIKTKAETIDSITFKSMSKVIRTINPDDLNQPEAPKKGDREVANDVTVWKGQEKEKQFSKSYYRVRDAYWFHFRVTIEIYEADKFVPYKQEVPASPVVKKVRLNEAWEHTSMRMAA